MLCEEYAAYMLCEEYAAGIADITLTNTPMYTHTHTPQTTRFVSPGDVLCIPLHDFTRRPDPLPSLTTAANNTHAVNNTCTTSYNQDVDHGQHNTFSQQHAMPHDGQQNGQCDGQQNGQRHVDSCMLTRAQTHARRGHDNALPAVGYAPMPLPWQIPEVVYLVVTHVSPAHASQSLAIDCDTTHIVMQVWLCVFVCILAGFVFFGGGV